MQLLGGKSPKRTVCWSNGSWISGLDLGKLKKEFRLANTTLKTVRPGLMREFDIGTTLAVELATRGF